MSGSGRLGKNSEAGLKLLSVLSAETERRIVVQKDGVVTVFVGAESTDAIEIDDGGAVDAAEQRRVEVLFKVREAATEQVRARADMQCGVVVGSFDPVDLGERDEIDLTGRLDGEPIELARMVFAEFDLLLARESARSKRALSKGLRR